MKRGKHVCANTLFQVHASTRHALRPAMRAPRLPLPATMRMRVRTHLSSSSPPVTSSVTMYTLRPVMYTAYSLMQLGWSTWPMRSTGSTGSTRAVTLRVWHAVACLPRGWHAAMQRLAPATAPTVLPLQNTGGRGCSCRPPHHHQSTLPPQRAQMRPTTPPSIPR